MPLKRFLCRPRPWLPVAKGAWRVDGWGGQDERRKRRRMWQERDKAPETNDTFLGLRPSLFFWHGTRRRADGTFLPSSCPGTVRSRACRPPTVKALSLVRAGSDVLKIEARAHSMYMPICTRFPSHPQEQKQGRASWQPTIEAGTRQRSFHAATRMTNHAAPSFKMPFEILRATLSKRNRLRVRRRRACLQV